MAPLLLAPMVSGWVGILIVVVVILLIVGFVFRGRL